MTDTAGGGRADGEREEEGSGEPGDRPVAVRFHGLTLELPEHGTGARAARRAALAATAEPAPTPSATRGPSPREVPSPVPAGPDRGWLVRFASAVLACLVVGAGLAYAGVSVLRDSRTGRTVTNATPDEPGYEAFLEPTPTLAVELTHEGLLQGVVVLSLGADETGGGVLLIPPDTQVAEAGTLAVARAFGSSEEDLRGSIEIVAGTGIPELVEVDDARWAELVAPVAPITFDNPDALPGFPAGPVQLEPEEVGPYLRARARAESELSRLARQGVFWEAWLSQLAAAGPGAVPGETEVGLGLFLRGLAAGPHQVSSLPVEETPSATGGASVFTVDEEARTAVVASLIPFPTGTALAPRPLVRLLDGTGDHDLVARMAPAVVAAGTSIVVVGNADRFDYRITEIRYHQKRERAAAERLQQELGVGEVIEDVRPIDAFGVTIVLGNDL